MSHASYHDPELWLRLGPRIEQHLHEASEGVLTHRLKTYEDYSNAMGYLRGLRWVLNTAADLTKIPDQPRDRDRERDI